MSPHGWVRFFARVMLGLIFLMAGWHKCFVLTPLRHAAKYFTGPYADSWIPHWLLVALGVSIPVVELAAGALLVVGLRVKEALLAIGTILLVVTYGHLLKESLFSITGHIFPRFILLAGVFLLPAEADRWSMDTWLSLRRPANTGPGVSDSKS